MQLRGPVPKVNLGRVSRGDTRVSCQMTYRLQYPPTYGPIVSFSSSHLSGLKLSASMPQIFLLLKYKFESQSSLHVKK